MLTRLIAALAVLILSATAPAVAQNSPTSPIVTAEQSTVILRATVDIHDLSGTIPDEVKNDVLICGGYVASSSGTVETIVTARHCTDYEIVNTFFMSARITVIPTTVQYFDGDTGHVTSVFQSVNSDVALLTVNTTRNHPAALVNKDLPNRGDEFFVLGHAGGRPFVYSKAYSAQGSDLSNPELDGYEFSGLMILDCASCYGGDSGSGVWNNNGQVVGILTAGMGQPAIAGAVPENDVTATFYEKASPSVVPNCVAPADAKVNADKATLYTADPKTLHDKLLMDDGDQVLTCKRKAEAERPDVLLGGRPGHTQMFVDEIGLIEAVAYLDAVRIKGAQHNAWTIVQLGKSEIQDAQAWAKDYKDVLLAQAVNDMRRSLSEFIAKYKLGNEPQDPNTGL